MFKHLKRTSYLLGLASVLLLNACSGTESSSSNTSASSTAPEVLSSSSLQNSAVMSSTQSSLASSSLNSISSSSEAIMSSAAQASSTAARCNTFEPVLKTLTNNNCIVCHGATEFNNLGGGLNLESGNVCERLLERKSSKTGAACGKDVIIDQADPGNSLLLKLINQDKHAALAAEGCNRNPMPFAAKTDPSKFMKAADYACVSRWVENVAATETPIEEPPKPGEFAWLLPLKTITLNCAFCSANF